MVTTGQHEEFLRCLALNDESTLRSLLGESIFDNDCVELDDRTMALIRLAAVVALESCPTTYQWSVGAALAAGASEDAIADVLVAVVPVIGATRVPMAAAALAAALGYPAEREGCVLARGESLQ
jgi:alkylhydroperoxidase/carboxymuconolactone decarboxylase family protein YurZ